MKHTDDAIISDEMVLNYHLMHPGGDSQPGDPNVAFCLDGIYHLHYILRHPWKNGISYSFIHVTSTDLLNWKWQPTMLQPSFTGHGMFSGTGFITKEGKPAAIYAGVAEPHHSYIAIAGDNRLSVWEKPYPVLPKGGPGGKDMTLRGDPDCFLIGDTYYAYSAVENVLLCKSTDLKHWSYVGPFLKHDMPDVAVGEDLSCANFYPFEDRWMLLCISHTIGCRYYLGDWDAKSEQFVPSSHGRMNWRRPEQSLTEPVYRDFFAPESVLTADGRRVMWAWLCTAHPEVDKKSVQSLPRELSLHNDGSLSVRPIRELETLRFDPVAFENVIVPPAEGRMGNEQHVTEINGDSFELRITVNRAEAERKRIGIRLFSGDDGEGLLVLVRPETGTICVGETEAPFAVADLPRDEDLELRIFVDKYLVEVFANDRQAALTVFMGYGDTGRGLIVYGFGGVFRGASTVIRRIEIWKLKPTNQGFLEARENRTWAPDID